MDEEIKVGSYDSFTNGMNSISKVNSSISDASTAIDGYKSQLLNESVLAGPIAESCSDGFTALDKKIKSVTDNFNTISSYLDQCKNNYQKTDDEAKVLYLSIKDNGQLEVTEGLAGGVYVNPNADKYQVDFINQILPAAIALYNEKGILPSLTIAQACKESAFGTARPGNGYNIYGIKASGWKGKKANSRTGEQTSSGKTYYINADFRDYNSFEESVKDYGEVLSQERYDEVRSAKDYKEAAHAVKKAGYATGVNYDNSLIHDYIEKYNLNQWDPKR